MYLLHFSEVFLAVSSCFLILFSLVLLRISSLVLFWSSGGSIFSGSVATFCIMIQSITLETHFSEGRTVSGTISYTNMCFLNFSIYFLQHELVFLDVHLSLVTVEHCFLTLLHFQLDKGFQKKPIVAFTNSHRTVCRGNANSDQ